MKRITIFIGFVFSIIFFFCHCTREGDFPVLKGPYLGQKPPGMTPEVFAPGIISTGFGEQNGMFSPDGSEFYFTIAAQPGRHYITFVMKRENDIWQKPEVSSFYASHEGGEAFISPDGNRLFFVARRAADGSIKNDPDIWFSPKTDADWGIPENLGAPVTSDKAEGYPSISTDGTLYFSSNRNDAVGGADIYFSRFIDGKFTEPENVSKNINTTNHEFNPCISPDGSYLIFNSPGRPEGIGGHDLYVSFHKANGTWTEALNLGSEINSEYSDYSAIITADGRYIFFSSTRSTLNSYLEHSILYDGLVEKLNSPQNGNPDIYWVDAKIIEELKSESLK